jgi:hypothetical protein
MRLIGRTDATPLPLLRRVNSHCQADSGRSAGQRAGPDALELDDADASQRQLHASNFRAIRSFMISVVPP